MAKKHGGDGLVVLAINAWDEPKDTLADFAKHEKLMYRILLDGGDVASEYGVTSMPTNIFVDKNGVMIDAALGFDGPKHIEAKTRKLLESSR